MGIVAAARRHDLSSILKLVTHSQEDNYAIFLVGDVISNCNV